MIRRRAKESARERAERAWVREDSLDPAGVAECSAHGRAIVCFRNPSPRQREAWDNFFIEHIGCHIQIKPIKRS